MRTYIIGCTKRSRKISGKKLGSVEAYQLYDLHSNTFKLVAVEEVNKKVKSGSSVIGLREQGKTVIPNSYYLYNTRQVDELDGAGEPITLPEERKEILLGIRGFKEKAVYRVVNSTGKTRELTYTELFDIAKKDKIIGAKVKTNKDGEEELKIYGHCSVQIYTRK